LNSIAISLIFVTFVMSGALLGGFIRSRLPKHHLDGDTKDIVKAGIGILATLSALVPGLIVASAKTSFDSKTEEIQTAAVKLMQLDRSLRQLGSAGDNARNELLQAAKMRVDKIWSDRDPLPAALSSYDTKPNSKLLAINISAG
jgi:hypothetical protein